MLINGKESKIIKIYPDASNSLKDMVLCENEHGIKECFHRYDFVYGMITQKRCERSYKFWDEAEKQEIRKLLKQGMKPYQVGKNAVLSGRTPQAVVMCARELLAEMKKGREEC